MNQLPVVSARASFPHAGIARRELARALSRLATPTPGPRLDAAWTVARDAQAWLGTLARA